MSPGQILPGQMSTWQLESVQDGPWNLLSKFGQNQVSNSWDITDMDKCRQSKCCLDKCRHDNWNKFKMVPGIYFWSLVKIWSVTAEIFLTWTNVPMTNVAWTNVPVTFKSVQDGPRNLTLKFCQNQVSNSWDIPDMDKCCQSKCCLDKCRHDSWNKFKMVPGIYF